MINIDRRKISISVDYDQSIEKMVKICKYDKVGDKITSRNFPSTEKGKAQIDIYLMGCDKDIKSEDAIIEMNSRGFRPATLKELLALGARMIDLEKINPLVALGSIWNHPKEGMRAPCLFRTKLGRHLEPMMMGNFWNESWRFVVVPKQPQKEPAN